MRGHGPGQQADQRRRSLRLRKIRPNVSRSGVPSSAGDRRDGSWSRDVADDCIFSDDDGNLTTKAKMIDQEKTWPPEYD
jgi:hypothetical protein